MYARTCVPSSVLARTYQLKTTPTWWYQANPWGKKSHRTDLDISSTVSLMTRMVRGFNLHGELGSCVRDNRGYIAPCFPLYVSLPPRLVGIVPGPFASLRLVSWFPPGPCHVPYPVHRQLLHSVPRFLIARPWPLPSKNSVASSFFIPFSRVHVPGYLSSIFSFHFFLFSPFPVHHHSSCRSDVLGRMQCAQAVFPSLTCSGS